MIYSSPTLLSLLILLLTLSSFQATPVLKSTDESALEWFIWQYQLDWIIPEQTTNVQCSSFQPDTSLLKCSDDGTDQFITSLNIQSSSIVNHDNITEPVWDRTLTNLTSFKLNVENPLMNKTESIFTILDGPSYKNVLKDLIVIGHTMNFTFPNSFSKIEGLENLELEDLTIVGDGLPATIFAPSLKSVQISGLQFVLPPYYEGNPLYFPFDGDLFTQLTFFDIEFPSISMIYSISLNQLPAVKDFRMKGRFSEGFNISSVTLEELTLISLNTEAITNEIGIYTMPSLTKLTFTKFKLSVPFDLGVGFPELREVYFDRTIGRIANATNLNVLSVTNSDMSVFPPQDWFQSNCTLHLSNNQLAGVIQDYTTLVPFNMFIDGNINVNGAVPDCLCGLLSFNFSGTSLTTFPDCYNCYADNFKDRLPSTMQIPTDFSCSVTIEKSSFYSATPVDSITIRGTNLGFGDETLAPLQMVIPNSVFVLPINKSLNGQMNVTFSSKFSTIIKWTNDITDVIDAMALYAQKNLSLSVYGTFGTDYVYTAGVNEYPCDGVSVSPQMLVCQIPTFLPTKSPSYTVWIQTPYQRIEIVKTMNNMNYIIVTSCSSISTNGGYIEFYGSFGDGADPSNPNRQTAASMRKLMSVNNEFPVPVIIVNDVPCTNQTINSTVVTCHVEGGLRKGVASLKLTIGEFTFDSKSLVVVESNANDDCGDDCNKNGLCINGKCQCDEGYGGYYCESKWDTSMVMVQNAKQPATEMKSTTSSLEFNIIAIQELNPSGSLVKELLLKDWTSTSSTNATLSSYIYTLNINQPQVSITFELSSQTRTVEFAGVTKTYGPNSLKVSMSINNWVFKTNLNNLRVLMRTNATSSVSDSCGSDFFAGKDENDNVDYIKITKDGTAYYGQFISFAISDGRPAFSKTEVVNSSSETGMAFLGIYLPQCTNCTLDPSFSALLDVQSQPGNCQTKSSIYWKIPVIVVCVIVGVIGIVAGTVLIVRKKLNGRRVGDVVKMKFLTRNNSRYYVR
ncbi:hypothetical protein SAMD00019534_037680 [Acytostelium subglobosum LB1]|uniref:hypothetical protein n=1 Tax=Acytostelium subglobosum LB1 TaxID=1410327 RepID=UPI000644C382|nr:hypothetical protein SAMD00019534_037680 [Acytostelium subglobosum LB1]GAM20593.1 hypothetical protein SAMD00019534_037680 [Acytostelium subglobosum LB1]|eukprot:XP_012760114.1 hypothetical protein SAMD00019534_037680 [Acytostelium subglobosum LB1]